MPAGLKILLRPADESGMQTAVSTRFKVLACAVGLLFAPLSLGCNALELLDESAAELDRRSPQTDELDADEDVRARAVELREKSVEWWGKAQSFTKGSIDESIVSCRLDGAVQFMREQDCRARGGRPAGR